MTAPEVSIIIPCYNNAPYVGAAIDSALGQTGARVEVIVVDDGSTDASPEVIATFGDRITALRQDNAGACVARNFGLSRARAPWIKFLDADDILFPDCAALQLAQARGGTAVVFGDCELFDDAGGVTPHPSHAVSSGLRSGDRATLPTFLNAPVLISTTLYPRKALVESGGFDPQVRRGQEHELHLRLYLGGVDFVYLPQICFRYRQHAAPHRMSVSRRRESYFLQIERFVRFVRLADEGPRRADAKANRLALGTSAWRNGRRLLRQGEAERAMAFFGLARDLAGSAAIHGRGPYRVVARLFGPVLAENVVGLARRLRGLSASVD